MENVAAIILAAGQGKRMNAKGVNKVVLPLNNKPMIAHTVDLLKNAGIHHIFVVVGFAKESVVDALSNYKVSFVEQMEQKGTANAVQVALGEIPETIESVLVLQGDDSAFYKSDLLNNLLKIHTSSSSAVTFLTVQMSNPYGLGRVVRDERGKVLKIVEEKDATEDEKQITEVNPACYVFDVSFLKKYLPMINKSEVTGEYYLTSLIDLAVEAKEPIETVSAGAIQWRGVNTPQELEEAEKIFAQGA